MNLLAQNISPHATEKGGESSAKPASDPLIDSAKGTGAVGSETHTEPRRKKPEELPTKAAEPSTTKQGSPEGSLETAPPLKIPPLLLEGDEAPQAVPAETGPKFALGLSPKAPLKEPGGFVLPESYGTERLWLAARDPHSLYARWDLTSEQQRDYGALAIGSRLVLRVHLEAVRDRPVIEVELLPEWRHCFIPVAFEGEHYLAELGYYQTDQRWRSIAVSEVVSTPQKGIAQDKTVLFATIPRRAAVAAQTTLFPDPSTTPPAPGGQTQEQARPSRPQSLAEIFTFSNPQGIPQPLPQTQPAPGAASEVAAFPSQKLVEGLIEAELVPVANWSPAQEQALAEVIDWRAAGLGAPISAEMGQSLKVPQVLAQPVGISSFPLEEQISSPVGGQFPEQGRFWLSVNAELVIYGATEPTARVTIGGRVIRLRPDGSFSFRFALPDGDYELPIEAASKQGDLRRVALEFCRRTTHQGEVQAHLQDPDLKKPDAGTVQQG